MATPLLLFRPRNPIFRILGWTKPEIHSFFLNNSSILGADTTAEQRHERCVKCRNALMDMQLNSAFIVDRMSAEQKLKFNSLLQLVEEITAVP